MKKLLTAGQRSALVEALEADLLLAATAARALLADDLEKLAKGHPTPQVKALSHVAHRVQLAHAQVQGLTR